MKPVYQISEYGSFITGKKVDGYITLPPHTFEQLESFVLTNRSKDADALELMGLSARKGIGKVITARNYVGIITMNDGTTIEILPKVYSSFEDDYRLYYILVRWMPYSFSFPWDWLTAIINCEPACDKCAAYCSQLTHRRKPSQGIR